MTERPVLRADIERYRRAIVALGSEATLEQLAEAAGESDLQLGPNRVAWLASEAEAWLRQQPVTSPGQPAHREG